MGFNRDFTSFNITADGTTLSIDGNSFLDGASEPNAIVDEMTAILRHRGTVHEVGIPITPENATWTATFDVTGLDIAPLDPLFVIGVATFKPNTEPDCQDPAVWVNTVNVDVHSVGIGFSVKPAVPSDG
jgi:hypothetical protein